MAVAHHLIMSPRSARRWRVDVAGVVTRNSVALPLVLLSLVAVIDYLTSVEMTFVLLTYLIPIVLGTWFRGNRYGVILAVLATGCSTAVFVHESPASPMAVVLNGAGSFGMFLALVWTLGVLRVYIERERLQLRATTEQLRHAERLNVIGVMAAGVAHELGTPLNVIAGTAELLEVERLPHAKVQELSVVVLNQTDKISAIIRHLLDFGRRGGGARTVVDLDLVAQSAVDLLASTARKHDSTISFLASPTRVRTRANSGELEQVLSNLILNGIQAMPQGGALRVRTSAEIRLGPDGATHAFAAIAVEDEGTGIAAADLPRIFDPFFTTKGVGEGTGLGLSVSYGIVHDHGGTIEVDSVPGRGTRFTMLLPTYG